jgi:hypothetical protein
MPVDKPKAGETEQEYLAYCIPAEIKAGKSQEQSAAICYNTYREETKMSGVSKIASKLREIQYRGIRLAEGDGLEDSCWEGYEAIGTKELDGRSVPNCVPITE